MNQIETYADFCFQLRQEKRVVDDVPEELKGIDEPTAYAIQDKLVAKLAQSLESHTIGYKIACTSQVAQDLLNTDRPAYGRLFGAWHYPSGVTLKAADYTMRVIEPEFAFTLSQDVPPSSDNGTYDAETIRPYVANVLPSIEIVHHRLAGWNRFNVRKLIADNAIHGGWVSGTPAAAWEQFDLENHEVKLYSNDQLMLTGYGHRVLDHPLNALAWLANNLPLYGRQLKAGEMVTTGVCMDVYTAEAGETIRADFGTLGEVVIHFV